MTITILDIVHRPVFNLKHDVSETVFCLHLQEEPTMLRPVDRASLPPPRLLGSTEWSPPEYVDTTQSPKRLVLNKRQDDG
jgi:hypothetical protein